MTDLSTYRFSESHEWFSVRGEVVTVGISQFAANELTDITYVEMKPVGTRVNPGDSVGEVESVKTTSDIYTVVGGEIVEVNPAPVHDPSLINSDPHVRGWLVKIRTHDTAPLDELLDAESYLAQYPVES